MKIEKNQKEMTQTIKKYKMKDIMEQKIKKKIIITVKYYLKKLILVTQKNFQE